MIDVAVVERDVLTAADRRDDVQREVLGDDLVRRVAGLELAP